MHGQLINAHPNWEFGLDHVGLYTMIPCACSCHAPGSWMDDFFTISTFLIDHSFVVKS